MRYLVASLLALIVLAHSALAQGTSGTTYTNLTVTDTATINLLQVNGASAFPGSISIGPGSINDLNSYGAQSWITGPNQFQDNASGNIAVISTPDSYVPGITWNTFPLGVIFKVNADDSGNPVPAIESNAVGLGMLPLALNYDEPMGQIGPVLIGTGDWDGYSYLQVACYTSVYNELDVTGPLEVLQPQGDISMGNFKSGSGGGTPSSPEDDAVIGGSFGTGNAIRAGSYGGPIFSGTSGPTSSGSSGN